MGERLHPEAVPKTLADLETWLQHTLQKLQEVIDFDHNAPGNLDEQVFYDAADHVTQAGIFALPFGATEIVEPMCRPRKAMPPWKAAICIRRILDWC